MKGRWMGLRSKALAAVGALRGLVLGFPGVPCLPSGALAAPQRQGALRELCRQGDEVCEGGWRAGLEGQMLCWGCGIAAAVAVRVTIPSLGHGGHS